MTSQIITHAAVNRPDLRWPFPPNMAQRLTGAQVTGLRRRSKYILADLSSGKSLLIHLGMSGRILISGAMQGDFYHDHPAPAKHDHVVLQMANGARITFNDARRFGAMDLLDTALGDAHPLLAKIGPEPFGNSFNAPYLTQRLKGRATPIKTALLDQHVVAGLGNIYVCEALWQAGLSPEREARTLSAKGARAAAMREKLAPAIRDVIATAIAAGGSTLRDHRQADGTLGYFQHSFNVYDRAGQACRTPGCGGTIQRMVQSGRSSFYCPRCQR